ncbi:YqgE/AlgH family protein [Siccirubricoccus deserti]
MIAPYCTIGMLARSGRHRHLPLMARRTRTATAFPPGPDDGYLAGQMLIAMPSLQNPSFARTVICLCAHSSEGAMGIVVNKPIDGLSFDELLKQLNLSRCRRNGASACSRVGRWKPGVASSCIPRIGSATNHCR